MACRIPVLPDRLSPSRSYQQEVLHALYESPELLNEGLVSFEYPLYEVSDEELDYFLGSLIHQVARTAGGVAKTIGKGVSTVTKVIPMPVLTAGLSWTPLGMAARAGLGALQAAGDGRNVFQGAMRSLAADPVSRFYIDTAAAAARGENILKAAQKAAQAGIGDLRQSLQFAAMVAPFIPGIGTGVAAALSAANALAAGQPITDALIAAARGAVPGGAIAQFAFDTAMNLAKGKNIGDALLASARDKIPGGPAAQAAFDAAVALAKGKNIQDAAFAAAGRLLPPSPYAADALSFVRKVASGQNIQRAALSTVGNAVLSRMQAMGAPPIPRVALPVPPLAFRRPLPVPFRRLPVPVRRLPMPFRPAAMRRELGEISATPVRTPPPPVTAKMDESQAREWIKRALDGTHAIGSVAEVLGIFEVLPAGSALALAAEIAVPVGYAALIAFVAIELWEAFTTGTRIQREEGFCFGVMWAALGMPDQPKNIQSWAPNTAGELRQAWQEGIAQGRKKFAEDIQLHNQVLLRIAYERLQKSPEPEAKVLNLMWEEVRGDDLPGTHINWTGGPDMIGKAYDASVDNYYWNAPPPSRELGEIGGSEQDFVRSQIANTNQRDAYKLTDLVFYRRHPEMRGRRIGVNETQLKNEWLSILRSVVQPVLRSVSPTRPGGSAPAPARDALSAGALQIASRPVPGMPGVNIQQLIEQWRPQIAPEIPLSVILGFLPFESGGNFDDATHGLPRNAFTSPPFYELGLFQIPGGLHGKCTTVKYQSCEQGPPGVENPRDLSPWFLLCRKIGADPKDWQNPVTQVRVGLLSIECPARRIRKLFPELFPMPGTDWDLRMAVLMAFARGGGFAQAFLSHYRKELASLPEDRRWDFLRGKSVPYRAGYYWTFDTSNVDEKMNLAARLGYRPGAGERSALTLKVSC